MPADLPVPSTCHEWGLPSAAQTLCIEGADVLAFAQSQFASDLRQLATGHWQWSTWLDAQGRVRALMQMARRDEQTLIALVRGGNGETLAQDLRRYVLRSRVRITPEHVWLRAQPLVSGRDRSATWEAAYLRLDAGTYALDLHASDPSCNDQADGRNAAALAGVRSGHAWLPDAVLCDLMPSALSLLRLRAASLGKGCYPGQEMVARLHYRGVHKRRLARLRLPVPQAPGTVVEANGSTALLLNGAADGIEWEALAVLSESTASVGKSMNFIVLEEFSS